VTERTLPPGLKYLGTAVLLFGGVWPITKDALEAGAAPLWFATARAGFATITSALLLAALGRLRRPLRSDLPAVLVIGLLQLGGFFALTHLALALVPAGRTAILGNVTIVWLVPLSVWLLREKVSGRQWAAMALGCAGIVLLMAPWSLGQGRLAGYAMLLGASLLWSIAILVVRVWPPRRPIVDLLPWSFALGTLVLLPLAWALAPGQGLGDGVWHAVFVGAIAAPIGTWAVTEAGRRLSGPAASVGFMLIPTFGVALATVWLGEPLGWELVAGGALILGGVLLTAKPA